VYGHGWVINEHPWNTRIIVENDEIYYGRSTPPFYLNDRIEIAALNQDGTIDLPRYSFPSVPSGEIHHLYKSDSTLYIGELGNVCVYVLSPDNGWIFASNLYVYGAAVAIEREGNYVYVLGNTGRTLHVYDVQDVYNPIQVASFHKTHVGDFDFMALVGDYVYISTSTGLYIVQIDLPVSAPPPPAPASLALAPAYPNPVASGSAATVEFALPASGHVTLTLSNTLGQELRRIEKRLEPGTHSERISTTGLNPGVYYYTLTAGGKRNTEMLVVR
jgi:hypothetical protein